MFLTYLFFCVICYSAFIQEINMQQCNCDCSKCLQTNTDEAMVTKYLDPRIMSNTTERKVIPRSLKKTSALDPSTVKRNATSRANASAYLKIGKSAIEMIAANILRSLEAERDLMRKQNVTFERLRKARLQFAALSTVQKLQGQLTQLSENSTLPEIDLVVKDIQTAVHNLPRARAGSSATLENLSSVTTDFMKIVMSKDKS